MPVMHLRDIGSSEDIRRQVAETDICPTSISLILDQPRTLKVVRKTIRGTELIVECREHDSDTRVVLYLSFRPGARASAKIITHLPDGS